MWMRRMARGALLLTLLFSMPTAARSGDVMLADFNGGKISRFDGTTGAFINDYILGASPSPHALIVGPNCNLFVASFGGSKVLRYARPDTEVRRNDRSADIRGCPGRQRAARPGVRAHG